jgi:hypothetical protein
MRTPSKEVLAPNSHWDKAIASNSGAQKNEQKVAQKNTQVTNTQKKPQSAPIQKKASTSVTQDKPNNKPPITQPSKPTQAKKNVVNKKRPMMEKKMQGIKKRKVESDSESSFSSEFSERSVSYSESSFESYDSLRSNGTIP